MKASEIKTAKPTKKVDKKVVEDINFLLQQLRPRPEVQADLEENVCGVIAGPGHEIHRLRKRNSDLMRKINNWD